MIHSIIIVKRNVINTLSMDIVLKDGLLVQILFASTQQNTIRTGKFLFILIIDEKYADQPCRFLKQVLNNLFSVHYNS